MHRYQLLDCILLYLFTLRSVWLKMINQQDTDFLFIFKSECWIIFYFNFSYGVLIYWYSTAVKRWHLFTGRWAYCQRESGLYNFFVSYDCWIALPWKLWARIFSESRCSWGSWFMTNWQYFWCIVNLIKKKWLLLFLFFTLRTRCLQDLTQSGNERLPGLSRLHLF